MRRSATGAAGRGTPPAGDGSVDGRCARAAGRRRRPLARRPPSCAAPASAPSEPTTPLATVPDDRGHLAQDLRVLHRLLGDVEERLGRGDRLQRRRLRGRSAPGSMPAHVPARRSAGSASSRRIGSQAACGRASAGRYPRRRSAKTTVRRPCLHRRRRPPGGRCSESGSRMRPPVRPDRHDQLVAPPDEGDVAAVGERAAASASTQRAVDAAAPPAPRRRGGGAPGRRRRRRASAKRPQELEPDRLLGRRGRSAARAPARSPPRWWRGARAGRRGGGRTTGRSPRRAAAG